MEKQPKKQTSNGGIPVIVVELNHCKVEVNETLLNCIKSIDSLSYYWNEALKNGSIDKGTHKFCYLEYEMFCGVVMNEFNNSAKFLKK